MCCDHSCIMRKDMVATTTTIAHLGMMSVIIIIIAAHTAIQIPIRVCRVEYNNCIC